MRGEWDELQDSGLFGAPQVCLASVGTPKHCLPPGRRNSRWRSA